MAKSLPWVWVPVTGVTCQGKSLKAGRKVDVGGRERMLPSYSYVVPALFLAKMPCTESVGLGRGLRAKCHRAWSILPHAATCGPCGMFRVMPAATHVCPRPWQLCRGSWRSSKANPGRSWPAQRWPFVFSLSRAGFNLQLPDCVQ